MAAVATVVLPLRGALPFREPMPPYRVVHTEDGGVVIIDYKFGEHNRRYERQIARYADIYRRMGYGNVSTALWYVDRDEVIHSA